MDVKLTGFHRIEHTDVSVRVKATVPQHLKSLVIKLCREQYPDSPLHTVRLDTLGGGAKNWGSPAAQDVFLKGGLLVSLPFLPRDGTNYLLIAESSLSSASHSYSETTLSFSAEDPYLALEMLFHAEMRSVEQENPRHLAVIFFIVLSGFLYFQVTVQKYYLFNNRYCST